jgi:hypothetical protein
MVALFTVAQLLMCVLCVSVCVSVSVCECVYHEALYGGAAIHVGSVPRCAAWGQYPGIWGSVPWYQGVF